jgi:hypothetical protein
MPEHVLQDAGQVFTGTITDARDGRIHVSVEEVWRGGPVEEQVWLTVELPGWTTWAGRDGEVPDGFSTPRTWLFVADDSTTGPCTSWLLSRELRQQRPDVVTPPVPEGSLPDQSSPEASAEPSPESASEPTADPEGEPVVDAVVDPVPAQEQSWPWPLLTGATGGLVVGGLALVAVLRRR